MSGQSPSSFIHTLRRRAVRQTATLRAAGAAVAFAPNHDECAAALERAREELTHLEQTVELYTELYGRELNSEIAEETAHIPMPQSWVEAVIAQFVLCVAAKEDARQRGLAVGFDERATERDVAEETEHVNAARAALLDLCADHPGCLDAASGLVDRWFDLALRSLDESVEADYVSVLRDDAASLGLQLPSAG